MASSSAQGLKPLRTPFGSMSSNHCSVFKAFLDIFSLMFYSVATISCSLPENRQFSALYFKHRTSSTSKTHMDLCVAP